MIKKSKLTKKSYHTSDLEVFKQLTMKSHRIVYNKWFLVTFFMYLVFALICYTTKGDDGDCLVPFLTHLRQDTMTHQITCLVEGQCMHGILRFMNDYNLVDSLNLIQLNRKREQVYGWVGINTT